MKKLMVLLAVSLMIMTTSGLALSSGKEVKGKVTGVSGDTITIEVEKGKASDISVGDTVEVEVKGDKKAPKKGMDMLMGC